MKLRCAIYARYSSDRQSTSSITDQVRKCREYATAHGWDVLDNCVFGDEAVSGATSERAGLKRLLTAAEVKAFDVLLIDDTSRLSRKTSDAMQLSERLRFFGVRVIFVSQNIDSESEQSELLVGVHGLVDSLYIKELATKTYRGIEGRVIEHQHSGGRIFGYRNVPIEHPERRDAYGRPLIAGARLAIDEAQAKTVRRIFQLYANGLSIKAVGKKLNKEHVQSPKPKAGRERAWCPSSIRGILRNARYRGTVTWGKTRKIRNPSNGRKIKRARPQADWITVQMPEQRIIPEALWLAVEQRLAYVNKTFSAHDRHAGLCNHAASSSYIFSGLLKCGMCGANYTLVSGWGKNHKSGTYGCRARTFRGTCTNARRIQRRVLEKELLAKLQCDVLSDAVVEYVLERFEEEVEKRFAALDGRMNEMQQRKKELEGKLKNLARFFEDGADSPTLRASMTAHEAEIANITAKTLGARRDSVHSEMKSLRTFVEHNMRHLRRLLTGKHSNPALAKQELARHIDSITLFPEGKGKAIKYSGSWKLLGQSDMARPEGAGRARGVQC